MSHGVLDGDGAFKKTSDYLFGKLFYGENGDLSILILFAEKPVTSDQMLGYSGVFKIIDDKTIEHHISISTNPKLTNTVEIRSYKLVKNILILSKKLGAGKTFQAEWRRIKG